jgi:hypothetical protein
MSGHMTHSEHDGADPHNDSSLEDDRVEHVHIDDHVASLRGATAVSVGRTLWLWVGSVCLVLFAVAIVVSFLSATNDNARINRMRNHGIAVNVTVDICIGNIGGSGSNAAGYTCHGTYRVGGHTFTEVIGSKTSLSVGGVVVQGIVDPSHHSTLELASAIRTSVASPTRYVAPGLLGVALIVLLLALLRLARRSPSPRPKPTATSSPQSP